MLIRSCSASIFLLCPLFPVCKPSPTMLTRILTSVVALFLGVTIPLTVRGQVSAPFDSVQRAAMMASAMQMKKPAEFVLQHRVELALSAAQVSRLEALAVAQGDSMVARQARLVGQMQANPPSSAMLAAAGWAGEVDERALRDALCQWSANQAETMLGLARDRRAAAAVLTPAQTARLPQLQTDDLLKAIKRP